LLNGVGQCWVKHRLGGGGGGGAAVSPIGFIEVRDSSAQFKRISTPTDVLAVVAAASIAALTIKRLLG
jgi:uncharacterized spore protein YtfJ